jgi:hypothetical protein
VRRETWDFGILAHPWQICELCSHDKKVTEWGPCVPIWRIKYHKSGILSCPPCLGRRKSCTFASSMWGMKSLPTVLKTEKGVKARAVDSAMKKRNSELKAAGIERSVSEGSTLRVTRSTASAFKRGTSHESSSTVVGSQPAANQVASSSANAVDPSHSHSINATPISIIWDNSVGRFEQIFLADLGWFGTALRSPNRTATSLGSLLIDLEAIRRREASARDVLNRVFDARAILTSNLIAQLAREAGVVAIGAGEDPESRTAVRDLISGVSRAFEQEEEAEKSESDSADSGGIGGKDSSKESGEDGLAEGEVE